MCAGHRCLVLGSLLLRYRRFTVKRFINFALFVVFLVGVTVLHDKAFDQMDRMGAAIDHLAIRS